MGLKSKLRAGLKRIKRSKVSQKKTRIDLDNAKSHHKGALGAFENFFRAYRDFVHMLIILPMYALAACVAGVAFVPGIAIFSKIHELSSQWLMHTTWPNPMATTLHYAALGAGIVLSYFSYGFTMVILLPLFNRVFGLRLKAWRGPYYSVASIPWYIHNGTTYLLRYTFLELITPTPISIAFYKGMGMKIGRGTVINTTHISDPSLISMGEKVTIGGSATIVGHYGQGGFLVLAPVTIGDRVTIGLKASIMGGVKIGKDAKILPHSVVMPKTEIPEGETWGGVPARKIELHELQALRKPA